MDDQLTDTVEDYLKAIYDLTSARDRATTNQLAERMGVTPASVTGMVKRLASAEPALVDYQKHRGVLLTPAGERTALEMIRHHRLLELFLQKQLGYSWDEVHKEAERLEHVISEDLEERIALALGDPQHDPHGEPIPTRDLQMFPQPTTRLSELQAGQRATLVRVAEPQPDLLRYLYDIGLVPQSELLVLERSPYDDNLRLQIADQETSVVLGPRVTYQIIVDIMGS
jgi:DtxR family Mn-dependent transcriptional regulator